jgi:hypothetical protein
LCHAQQDAVISVCFSSVSGLGLLQLIQTDCLPMTIMIWHDNIVFKHQDENETLRCVPSTYIAPIFHQRIDFR